LIAIPPDVIKSRWQTAEEGRYRSIFHVLSSTIKHEGYRALYKGVGPALLRAFPANAACFFGMEVSKSFFESLLK